LARSFFDPTEIELLKRSAKDDRELDRRSFGRAVKEKVGARRFSDDPSDVAWLEDKRDSSAKSLLHEEKH
jgi:hypothetical protein